VNRTELIKAIAAVIRETGRLDQAEFITNPFGWGELYDTDVPAEELRKYAFTPIPYTAENPDRPYCGTMACVAGWAVILGSGKGRKIALSSLYSGSMSDGVPIWDRAKKLMKISEDQASYLFTEDRTREEVLEMLDALVDDPRWLP